MKKLIVIGIVAAMVMGLAAAASAGVNDNWVIQLRASDLNGANFMTATQFGTNATKTDGNDAGTDALLSGNPGTAAEIYCTDLGGASPRWYKDIRAPFAGATKVWNLVLTAGISYADTKIKVTGWNPTGASYDLLPSALSGFTVTLYQGPTVIYRFDPDVNGTSTAPQFTKIFDYSGSPIALQLKMEPIIPEPGSMVAVLSGLVGLVGFGIRRRK